MWLSASPKIIYTGATIISTISTDLLSKVINLSLTGLEHTVSYMTSTNSITSIKKYQDDLELLDINLKLQLIDNWLKLVDINSFSINSNISLIYNYVSESCHKIADSIEKINDKIKYHNTKWFQSWRSIQLDDEIKILEKNVKILDERIKLISLIK